MVCFRPVFVYLQQPFFIADMAKFNNGKQKAILIELSGWPCVSVGVGALIHGFPLRERQVLATVMRGQNMGSGWVSAAPCSPTPPTLSGHKELDNEMMVRQGGQGGCSRGQRGGLGGTCVRGRCRRALSWLLAKGSCIWSPHASAAALPHRHRRAHRSPAAPSLMACTDVTFLEPSPVWLPDQH